MVHIYKITNKLNGKQYVGQTVNKINLRFNQHVSYAKRAKESGKALFYLSKAILKYGKDAFNIELIETVPLAYANEREIYWIGVLGTFGKGYNLSMGGHFRAKPTGKEYKPTASHKLNMSLAKKGRSLNWSEESLAAVTAAKLGKNNPNYGKKAKRVICEHCSKDVAKNIYVQYHGNKCKSLKSKV